MRRMTLFLIGRLSQSCRTQQFVQQFDVFTGTKKQRSNERCSVPQLSPLQSLRRQGIPTRLCLDAVGRGFNGYKPGTMWCNECFTRVDKEKRFTTQADYKPPVLRTNEKVTQLKCRLTRTCRLSLGVDKLCS